MLNKITGGVIVGALGLGVLGIYSLTTNSNRQLKEIDDPHLTLK